MLTWKKTGTGEGYTATSEHGSYFAERQPDGKFQAILDGCDEYGPPELLRTLKDRCQALDEDRAERSRKAGAELPAPVQPTLNGKPAGGQYGPSPMPTDEPAAEGENRADPTLRNTKPAAVPAEPEPAGPSPEPAASAGSSSAPEPLELVAPVAGSLASRLDSRLSRESDPSPHVIVTARAGVGKTTTLITGLQLLKGQTPTDAKGREIEPSPQQRAVWDAILLSKPYNPSVCFVAFNKSIAEELKRRVPQGCEASTMHGMGFKAVNAVLGRTDVNQYRVSDIIGEILGRDPRDLRREKVTLVQATEKLVGLCKMNLVTATDPDLLCEHIDALAQHYDVELADDRRSYRAEVFDLVPRVLERCKDVRKGEKIDYDDMIWLPVALDLPVRRYGLLLVDEAQDLNRCQQALAKKAGERLILCGDPKQCQPAGTLVSLAGTKGNRWHHGESARRVPIEEVKAGDTVVGYCPKDGRNYINRIVEEVVSRGYNGDLIEVTTEEGTTTRYTPEHRCYASFGALRDCHCVYLMRRGGQYRIGSCQINYKASGNGLVHRLRTEGGDAAWLVEVHPSKREARLREMELSYEYNLPQIVFKNANDGYILDDEGVERFWDFVGDNGSKTTALFKKYGLEPRHPVAVPGEQWQQSFKRPAIFAASNLIDGMEVRTEEGRWVRIKVKRVKYNGLVYSLKVSHDELYMGDGIVTHNSIYGFAGADSESMKRMERELAQESSPPRIETENCPHCFKFGVVSKESGIGNKHGRWIGESMPCPHCKGQTWGRGVVVLPLTVTRRCGKAIVHEARKIVPDFEAFETNGEGKVSYAKF